MPKRHFGSRSRSRSRSKSPSAASTSGTRRGHRYDITQENFVGGECNTKKYSKKSLVEVAKKLGIDLPKRVTVAQLCAAINEKMAGITTTVTESVEEKCARLGSDTDCHANAACFWDAQNLQCGPAENECLQRSGPWRWDSEKNKCVNLDEECNQQTTGTVWSAPYGKCMPK